MADKVGIDIERLRRLEERENQLLAKEKEFQDREKAVMARESAIAETDRTAGDVRIRTGITACKGTDPCIFSVGPKNEKYKDRLPTLSIEACDEGEAMRFYILTVSDPDVAGKQVDPLTHQLKAVILNPEKRRIRQAKDKRNEFIRRKFNKQMVLTEEETDLLQEMDMV